MRSPLRVLQTAHYHGSANFAWRTIPDPGRVYLIVKKVENFPKFSSSRIRSLHGLRRTKDTQRPRKKERTPGTIPDETTTALTVQLVCRLSAFQPTHLLHPTLVTLIPPTSICSSPPHIYVTGEQDCECRLARSNPYCDVSESNRRRVTPGRTRERAE